MSKVTTNRHGELWLSLFAQEMTAFRTAQLQRLAQAAEEAKATLPEPTFEQQVLIDNLKPLDFLALSRRYAELAENAAKLAPA